MDEVIVFDNKLVNARSDRRGRAGQQCQIKSSLFSVGAPAVLTGAKARGAGGGKERNEKAQAAAL
jgi:hypothetical protein